MAKLKGSGSTKRFGARYGRPLKRKFEDIETESRRLHKCPYCNKVKVKRITAGIWQCRKCDAKFTGKAYTLSKRLSLKEEVKKE
ncbi:MAG: 50S ribosomal protein L37ae [Candidatus Woesearchaeota archaeon]|jgi:large subunit ribosomal protein L37Ae|nr:50S ribosomal protein L37ae [Candidatus Woesearchaeota archaeon]